VVRNNSVSVALAQVHPGVVSVLGWVVGPTVLRNPPKTRDIWIETVEIGPPDVDTPTKVSSQLTRGIDYR